GTAQGHGLFRAHAAQGHAAPTGPPGHRRAVPADARCRFGGFGARRGASSARQCTQCRSDAAMSFEELQAKVTRAEDMLEAQERRVAANLRALGGSWRDAWTPPRIIVAGLAAGFLAGWARPARAVAGIEPARWLQLAGSLAGLVGT